MMDNTIASDPTYITNYSGDSGKWQNSNYYGTSNWHSNWLKTLRTGTFAGNTQYGKLFSWYLMDEPFHTVRKRDAASNEASVSGHSAFCSGVENSGTPDRRPMMLDILPSADTAWNRLSGQVGILCGNEYGYCLSPLSTAIWKNPNMVKWCWSKVSNDTNKMVMAWLPGFANSNATSGETHMKYMFYASIIEGARGVLWYMSDDVSYTDYSNYTYLSGIRADFTNDVTFKTGSTKPDH
jgi:hypothetical protein